MGQANSRMEEEEPAGWRINQQSFNSGENPDKKLKSQTRQWK